MPAGEDLTSAADPVRRILLAEIDRAIAGLSRAELSDETVHEVRKDLKRARATLRLLRPAIGPRLYHRYNLKMRDAARPLTPVRDAMILLATLKELAKGARGSASFLSELRSELRDEHTRAREQLAGAEIKHLRTLMSELRQSLQSLSEQLLDRRALREALQRSYRVGRKAFRRAQKTTSDEQLHEWRKQTKYYLHQLEVVALLEGDRFAKRRKRASRLSDRLGDDHDLAVLHARMLARAADAPSGSAVKDLLRTLARRRKRLQRKAARLGEQLYSKKPRRVGRKAARRLAPRATRLPAAVD
jgi:CHAD domain-containing protein